MPSTYTASNRIVKQSPGENNNAWGDILNDNGIAMIDEALDGISSFTLSGSKSLSMANGSTDESRPRVINITSGSGGTVTISNVKKNYLVRNATTGTVTFTTGSGTTCTVPPASSSWIICEGGNVCRTLLTQDGSGWASYSPGISTQSGSLTSASVTGRYKQVGKTVHFTVNSTITTNGTGAGYIVFGLPVAAFGNQSVNGCNINNSIGVQGRVFNSFCTITRYDGVYPGVDGANIIVTGTYEAA